MTKLMETMEVSLRVDDEMVAQCILREPASFDTALHKRERPLIELTDVYVKPRHRGKGYARAVVQAAVNIINGQLCDAVLTVISHPRGGSIGLEAEELTEFYCKFGFKLSKRDKGAMVRRCRIKNLR